MAFGLLFPNLPADVLATAAPVVGDLLTYTVAPLHAIRTCAVCREGSGRSPADRFGPASAKGRRARENNVVLCNMFHTGTLMVG